MNFANESLMKAVSWTLIHSLWLGLVLALLAGLVILLTRKKSAAMRYNLLAVLAVLFLVTIGFTFNYEFNLPSVEPSHTAQFVEGNTEHEVVHQNASFLLQDSVSDANSVNVKIIGFINEYTAWIVWGWFLVFSFKCFRMAAGMRHIYRIRNYQNFSPSERWQNRMQELKTALNISRRIELLESRLVNVPSVTGFFKPMILVPIGMLNNLPQEQVEAILLHELAHIRRSDYVINLIQGLMEIVFFFNPGVLWISSLLKDERENCCDDLAISVTRDKKEFVHALVSFQEYNLSGEKLALQFGSQKMNLANRAGRILFNRNTMLNSVEKCFLGICIAMSTLVCFAFVNVENPVEDPLSRNGLHTDSMVSDSLYINRKYDPATIAEGTTLRYIDQINEKESIVAYLFKHKNILYQVSQDLKTLRVNGKLITGNQKKQYLPVLNSLIDACEKSIDDGNRVEAENRRVEAESQRVEDESIRREAEARRIEDEAKRVEGESRRVERETRRVDTRTTSIQDESWRAEATSSSAVLSMLIGGNRVDLDSRRISTVSDMETKCSKAEVKNDQVSVRIEKESNDITFQVIREMKNNGFKGNINSFELDENNLIVNNKKYESEELHGKLKKYIKPGMRVLYKIEIN